MRIDLDRLTPMGVDGRKEGIWLSWALGIAAGWNLLSFVREYVAALDDLYYRIGDTRALIPGRMMTPFLELTKEGSLLFPAILALAAVLAIVHYAGHYSGSKSIYLMRRLPDRLELHRRCLGLPVLTAVGAMAILGLQTGLHYLIYILCTPKQCL